MLTGAILKVGARKLYCKLMVEGILNVLTHSFPVTLGRLDASGYNNRFESNVETFSVSKGRL